MDERRGGNSEEIVALYLAIKKAQPASETACYRASVEQQYLFAHLIHRHTFPALNVAYKTFTIRDSVARHWIYWLTFYSVCLLRSQCTLRKFRASHCQKSV